MSDPCVVTRFTNVKSAGGLDTHRITVAILRQPKKATIGELNKESTRETSCSPPAATSSIVCSTPFICKSDAERLSEFPCRKLQEGTKQLWGAADYGRHFKATLPTVIKREVTPS
ncbi:hypothetical protein L596_018696 [Steinernema carpocapsae]|uniref:Uncharacterized protein n=1 Tax=Steinernema carpocapsae TaxID=34508 RepID=A0A4U5N5X0_STECR|nr:hypothetical protein L596_018696 [Steinernema carpocapsae]